VYPVNYPADTRVDMGANDMSRHIQWMTRNCPRTRLVLGGYSLGAAATDLVLAVPISAFTFNSPLPAGTDRHVAAVALFGNGANWALPITALSPAYRNRTIDLCHSDDPVCNPSSPYKWRSEWQDHLAPGYIRSAWWPKPPGSSPPDSDPTLTPPTRRLLARFRRFRANNRRLGERTQSVRRSRVTAIRAASSSSGG
jgi:hypothetical protein